MDKQPAPVLLRDLDAKGAAAQPFEAGHAERLLAYPGSRFVKAGDDTPPAKEDAAPFVPRVNSKPKKGLAAAETAPVAPSEPTDATPIPA